MVAQPSVMNVETAMVNQEYRGVTSVQTVHVFVVISDMFFFP